MILLILVALLWIAVLAPSAWRRFSERRGVGSIDHFHHQLQLLEHAGPKTVSPAYRLHTALADGSPEVGTTIAAVDSPGPKLVLLRPTDDAAAADIDDGCGGHYERVQVLDPPEPACVPEAGADLRALRRVRARRRCTVLLRCLAAVAVSTGLIGILPGMHLVWVGTAISGLALVALLGLVAYAKELEAEQARRRGRLAARPLVETVEVVEPLARADVRQPIEQVEPVAAGARWARGQAWPEGWDDVWEDDAEDFELPRAAAR